MTSKSDIRSPQDARGLVDYDFESHTLMIDGHRYHYLDEGQGPVLLMVHGNPTWSFAWRHLIRNLAADHRVVAIDHIGCGLSDKPQDYNYCLSQHIANLKQLIEHMDLERITLVAHDWGGAIGMGAAGDLADRFQRFVLCNTAAFPATRIPRRIQICRFPLLGSLAIRGANLFCRAALRMAVVRHDRMTDEVRRGYLLPYDSWNHRIAVDRFVKDIPMCSTHPSYQALQDVENGLSQFVDAPMLLLWGERDWCFTLEFLREFQRRFPQAECCQIAEAGHYVFEDAHEKMIIRMRAFLSAHPLDC
ncbi:MAG: alpha/beta fold hydrolase [Planctomycetaceae bacterium]